MADVTQMSIEELTEFVEEFPAKSVCERTQLEKLKQYLEHRIYEELLNGNN